MWILPLLLLIAVTSVAQTLGAWPPYIRSRARQPFIGSRARQPYLRSLLLRAALADSVGTPTGGPPSPGPPTGGPTIHPTPTPPTGGPPAPPTPPSGGPPAPPTPTPPTGGPPVPPTPTPPTGGPPVSHLPTTDSSGNGGLSVGMKSCLKDAWNELEWKDKWRQNNKCIMKCPASLPLCYDAYFGVWCPSTAPSGTMPPLEACLDKAWGIRDWVQSLKMLKRCVKQCAKSGRGDWVACLNAYNGWLCL